MSASERTEQVLVAGIASDTHLSSQAIACADCDLLQVLPPLAGGARARCTRCGRVLAHQPAGARDLALALTLTAAIAYVVANLLPIMALSAVGRSASTTIAGGVYQMWMQGQMITAVLVAFCTVIAPGCYLLVVLALLLAALRSPIPQWAGELLRWMRYLQVWSMCEVMMLGVLIALVKIAELATVTPGIGLYAFGGLVLLLPAISLSLDVRALWQRVAWVDGTRPPLSAAGGPCSGPPR
jgi:paraquat-inducible protein A